MYFIELFVPKIDDAIAVEIYWESRISGSEYHVLYSGWNEFYMYSQVPNSKECPNGKRECEWDRFGRIYKTQQGVFHEENKKLAVMRGFKIVF